jgi:4-hydroxymandelate oxidase
MLARETGLAVDDVDPDPLGLYYRSGAGHERTLAASNQAWDDIWLRPHVLNDVTTVDTTVCSLGELLKTPLVAAPTAFVGLLHDDAETGLIHGAIAAGAIPVVAARSTTPVEVYGQGGMWWQQIYAYTDWSLTEDLAVRAAACGARALVFTVDAPILPRNRRFRRQQLNLPDGLLLANHPGATDAAAALQSPAVTGASIERLQRASGLPVIVKGVLRGDDARRAVDHGAAMVWVSNHGGRQLDGAVPTAWVLAEVRAAIPDGTQVIVDGGIRCGKDVLVAIALGADLVALGRPVAEGMRADGRDGVHDVLTSVASELREAMQLCGITSVAEITADLVRR